MFDYWDYCENKDILTPIMPMLDRKEIYIRDDNKIAIPTVDTYSSPWIHARIATDRQCGRYHRLYFKYYGFIPKKCMECWKVVQRPRNLKELFEVWKYQRELKEVSKCGIERRPFVHGNYGAYWYNNTKEEGFERKESLLKDFPKIPTILKRGCTEFEIQFGPSDRWQSTDLSLRLEETLSKLMVSVRFHDGGKPKTRDGSPSPWYVNEHSKRMWVEFAYDRGDPTYKLYTKSKPLVPPVITYDPDIDNDYQVDRLIKLAK